MLWNSTYSCSQQLVVETIEKLTNIPSGKCYFEMSSSDVAIESMCSFQIFKGQSHGTGCILFGCGGSGSARPEI